MDYSKIFTKPEENNCFSIIAQVIIRAIAFLQYIQAFMAMAATCTMTIDTFSISTNKRIPQSGNEMKCEMLL